MNDEIRLDRETFKALAADTRVSILKSLSKRRMTGAELASQVGLSSSTIKEHLDQLEKVSLIEQIDEGRKWKYYSLTYKGRQITTTERPSMRVWIVLGLSILALAFTTMNLFFFGSISAAPNYLSAESYSAKSAYGASQEAAALNSPAPAALNPCDATPNSCLSEPQSLTASASDSTAPDASRSVYSASSGVPTQQQVSTIDLAIETALVALVLGLGYYAIRQKKRAAF